MNDFLRAYGNFDVQKGRFSLYADFTTSEGACKGYVKPFFSDLKFVWEAILGAASAILKNKPQGKVATEIPISGNFENKDVDYWAAIANLLRNAFFQTIKPGFETKK